MVKYKEYRGKPVAIQLLDGSKIFGTIYKWTKNIVWVDIENKKRILDIPKDITQRILVVF